CRSLPRTVLILQEFKECLCRSAVREKTLLPLAEELLQTRMPLGLGRIEPPCQEILREAQQFAAFGQPVRSVQILAGNRCPEGFKSLAALGADPQYGYFPPTGQCLHPAYLRLQLLSLWQVGLVHSDYVCHFEQSRLLPLKIVSCFGLQKKN